ncbi:MAG: hypothetical protein M1829_001407 [Trizodia sp. TS-e1964]|nr:MAG: hypothetical protein M1829_001407 [Trizodia sp. TS-e1964]
MGVVMAIDDYYLTFDKLTDFAGGTNFVLLAIFTLGISGQHHARQIVCSVFLAVWAARLSGFLLFRILKTGTDSRFDDKRDKFFAFLGFWIFQMVWVWTVSLPVTVLNSPNITQFPQPDFGTGRDIAGVIFFGIGFLMESIADIQKFRFREANKDRKAICGGGLFSWTRHPNYFGEILVQFGIYMTAVSPAAYDGYVTGQPRVALNTTIVGAFFLTFLLMFVSGLNLQERPAAKKRYDNFLNWQQYHGYLERTSILIPFPPQIYVHLPVFLKRTLFLEFPIYVFDPEVHSEDAIERRRVQGERRDAGDRLEGDVSRSP